MTDLSNAPTAPLDPIDVDLDDVALNTSKDAVEIELPDGSVRVNLGTPQRADTPSNFFDNLAEHMEDSELLLLGAELCEAIEEDDSSRSEWLQTRADGMKLLAIKVEDLSGIVERSKARSTLLLEAVLRFQANASGELMPTDGPAKVRNDSQDVDSVAGDNVAEALEKDLNHYLTTTASEYYPDTDRMLFMLGFGGCGFKKVYSCPIRRRPVSESVPAEDLIVSNAATDLANADRVTHQVKMRPRVLKRMQKLGAYRDIDLTSTYDSDKNAVDQAKENISGVSAARNRPEEDDFILYECYCQLDLAGFEHKEGDEPSGLPLPYKVVVEKSSQTILEIRRNYAEDDEMQQAKEVFVKFPFVPGLGFYDLGLLQIAGNPTIAATALLRCGIDASIFANFPGFVHAKQAGRQTTNVLNVMPGTSAPIDLGGIDDIRKFMMPLPYKPPDGTLLQLMENQTEAGSRVAGTAEVQVGEGRQDAPVGTTIAMIEQATKVMDAVHKRLCRAQAREIQLLRDLFREDPEAFWRFNKKPALEWTKETFIAALENNDFVPAADPNTASHLQRIMRAQALYMMVTATPDEFNVPECKKIIVRALGYNNPDSLLNNAPKPPPPPDPKAQAANLSAQAALTTAQAKQQQVGVDAQKVQADTQVAAAKLQGDQQQAQSDLQRSALVHQDDLKSAQMIEGAKIAAAREEASAKIISAHAQQDKDHAHDIVSQGVSAALAPKPAKPEKDKKA